MDDPGRPPDTVTFEWLENDSVTHRISMNVGTFVTYTASAMSMNFPTKAQVLEMTGIDPTDCPHSCAVVAHSFTLANGIHKGLEMYLRASEKIEEDLGIDHEDP